MNVAGNRQQEQECETWVNFGMEKYWQHLTWSRCVWTKVRPARYPADYITVIPRSHSPLKMSCSWSVTWKTFTTAFVFRNPPWSFGSSLRKSVRWRNYMKKVWNISSWWNKTASVPPSTSLSNTARTPPGRASLHGKKDIRRWNSAVSWNWSSRWMPYWEENKSTEAGTLIKDKDSCFLLYRRKTSKSITFHIRVIRSQIGTKWKSNKKRVSSIYNRIHRTDLKNPVINHKTPHTI